MGGGGGGGGSGGDGGERWERGGLQQTDVTMQYLFGDNLM